MIVTHNMQQAARVSDMTAFFTVELHDEGRYRTGAVVEYEETDKIFTNPDDKRTEDYVTGSSARPMPPSHSTSSRSSPGSRTRRSARSTSSSTTLDRTLEALHHRDIELAAIVIADDDRIDGRYLEVHQGILSLLACRRRWPATSASSRRSCT